MKWQTYDILRSRTTSRHIRVGAERDGDRVYIYDCSPTGWAIRGTGRFVLPYTLDTRYVVVRRADKPVNGEEAQG